MAVTLIRKAPVQPIAPTPAEEPLTERQTQALVDQGILPEQPKKGGLTIIRKKEPPTARRVMSFAEGDKVRITNDLYAWVNYWKTGDTGTVIRVGPYGSGASDEERRRYAVVVVKLDKPRPPENRSECYFHAWELEVLPKEAKNG